MLGQASPLAPTVSYTPLIPSLTTLGCGSDLWLSFLWGAMKVEARCVLSTAETTVPTSTRIGTQESSKYLRWGWGEGL